MPIDPLDEFGGLLNDEDDKSPEIGPEGVRVAEGDLLVSIPMAELHEEDEAFVRDEKPEVRKFFARWDEEQAQNLAFIEPEDFIIQDASTTFRGPFHQSQIWHGRERAPKNKIRNNSKRAVFPFHDPTPTGVLRMLRKDWASGTFRPMTLAAPIASSPDRVAEKKIGASPFSFNPATMSLIDPAKVREYTDGRELSLGKLVDLARASDDLWDAVTAKPDEGGDPDIWNNIHLLTEADRAAFVERQTSLQIEEQRKKRDQELAWEGSK